MKSLGYLNKYFIKYKWRLLAGILFVIASNYFAVRMPLFLKETIDNFINSSSNDFNILGVQISIDTANLLTAGLWIGLTFISLSFLKGLFLFFMRQTIIKVSRFIEYDLKNEIYQHYQELDYTFYKRNKTGDLMNRISEDVTYVRMYLGPGIMYTINLIVLCTMVLFQMVKINWFLTIVVLLPLPIMSFIIYKVSSRINRLSKTVQEEQSNLSSIVQESFSGIRIIKAYSRENEVVEDFKNNSKDYKKKSMRLVLTNALFMPTILFLIGLSTILSIYVGGLMKYDAAITLGGITAFIFYVNNLTWPFASIGWVTSIIQRAAASQTRINEFLSISPDIVSPTKDEFELDGTIAFENVSYTYPNSGITAVKNLSFTINSGETVAIIGRTGCGKSTVLSLLLRQIDPTEGEIKVNTNPLSTINLQDYRSQVGIVPQDVFLFSDTIANNIRFGLHDRVASLEEVKDVAKQAHVYHNIVAFEDAFETELGERGVNLSGGQKQRVSIARALIRNPKLLVFDDCLSAVDTETEERILTNLKNNLAKKTGVIVSHRVSSIRNADKIIVLDDGKKIEEGSHVELMSSEGAYFSMYQKQLAEEE